MVILGFKSKKDEVLDHWISFADGLSLSPQEVYDALEKELAARKIPSMEMFRVEYSEGGLLSDKRLYLRMIRERLAFETCAAPFGNSFFFSCRSIYSPAVVRLWHLVAVLLFFSLVWVPLVRLLGFEFAGIALIGLIIALVFTFRGAKNLADVDAMLMNIPAFGPIYERWFRVDTYFRQDARLVYLKIVPEIFKSVAENMSGERGIKLVQQYQRAPILGELYKPIPPKSEGKA